MRIYELWLSCFLTTCLKRKSLLIKPGDLLKITVLAILLWRRANAWNVTLMPAINRTSGIVLLLSPVCSGEGPTFETSAIHQISQFILLLSAVCSDEGPTLETLAIHQTLCTVCCCSSSQFCCLLWRRANARNVSYTRNTYLTGRLFKNIPYQPLLIKIYAFILALSWLTLPQNTLFQLVGEFPFPSASEDVA